MRYQALLLCAACVGTLSACSKTDSLECPVPQLQSADGVLKETAADIRSYQDRFRDGFSQNEVDEAIASLRQKYPIVGTDAISNYLVAAYCPVAVEQEVGRDAQQEKLGQFENEISAILRE